MHTLKIELRVQDHLVQVSFSLQETWFKKEGFLVPLPTTLSGAAAFCCWSVVGTKGFQTEPFLQLHPLHRSQRHSIWLWPLALS